MTTWRTILSWDVQEFHHHDKVEIVGPVLGHLPGETSNYQGEVGKIIGIYGVGSSDWQLALSSATMGWADAATRGPVTERMATGAPIYYVSGDDWGQLFPESSLRPR